MACFGCCYTGNLLGAPQPVESFPPDSHQRLPCHRDGFRHYRRTYRPIGGSRSRADRRHRRDAASAVAAGIGCTARRRLATTRLAFYYYQHCCRHDSGRCNRHMARRVGRLRPGSGLHRDLGRPSDLPRIDSGHHQGNQHRAHEPHISRYRPGVSFLRRWDSACRRSCRPDHLVHRSVQEKQAQVRFPGKAAVGRSRLDHPLLRASRRFRHHHAPVSRGAGSGGTLDCHSNPLLFHLQQNPIGSLYLRYRRKPRGRSSVGSERAASDGADLRPHGDSGRNGGNRVDCSAQCSHSQCGQPV